MAAALAIAAGVSLTVLLRTTPESPAAAKPALVSEETRATPNNDFDSYEKFSRVEPDPEPRPKPRSEQRRTAEPEPATKSAVEPQPVAEEEPAVEEPVVESQPQRGALAAGEEGFPVPDEGEIARLDEPKRFAPDPGANLTLSLPSLGVRNAPVYDSDSSRALKAGVGHVPETSMPWDGGDQRNTYLAAHRLGYPGTGSRLLFYELDKLEQGDEVVLRGKGKTYRYRVSEILVVDPDDSWVMGQVRGRDMVTLQTCTPVPTFEKRLVVRADRV